MINKSMVITGVLIFAFSAWNQISFAQDYHVSGIGGGGPHPADKQLVPGVAGRWFPADIQGNIRDSILNMERVSAADCATPHIINTFTAAPLLLRINRPAEHLEIQAWIVDRCGSSVEYLVGIMTMPSGVFRKIRLRDEMLTELAEDDQLFRDAVEERDRDRASGDWLDLNLPVPLGWKLAFTQPESDGVPAIYEYLPRRQKLKNWKTMLTIQVISEESRPTPAELIENARQRRKELCGSEQEAMTLGNDGSMLAPTAPDSSSAQVLLICERVSESKKAEVTLAKALAGKNHLYYVHWGWRVRTGNRAKVLQELETELEEALAMMEQVRLCNPVMDPDRCANSFFL
jgi:hypothetical protein